MSFFTLSDNTVALPADTFKETAIEPIPSNTNAPAIIEGAEWKEYEGDNYINLTWAIVDGEYKGRKVFQKLRVEDASPQKRDRALKMLSAIDSNCGGYLRQLGAKPSDIDLKMRLSNKPMTIKVEIWEINDKSGNWVSAIAPINAIQQTEPAPATIIEDDIPF